jgi:hypothetical protein
MSCNFAEGPAKRGDVGVDERSRFGAVVIGKWMTELGQRACDSKHLGSYASHTSEAADRAS